MKKFMDEDFLLTSDAAKKLYHDYAENMPIVDYHCHINPQEICEDRKFENITQVWLGGDHYKWRQMRSNGVDEKYITGDATDREKFREALKNIADFVGVTGQFKFNEKRDPSMEVQVLQIKNGQFDALKK